METFASKALILLCAKIQLYIAAVWTVRPYDMLKVKDALTVCVTSRSAPFSVTFSRHSCLKENKKQAYESFLWVSVCPVSNFDPVGRLSRYLARILCQWTLSKSCTFQFRRPVMPAWWLRKFLRQDWRKHYMYILECESCVIVDLCETGKFVR
jgi:hypothetical protein